METQKVIQQKIKQLSNLGYSGGLDSVLFHIEIAEKHFEQACLSKEDHLFTDVIYRTNHAYEGILKESFSVIARKTEIIETPFKIEKYFLENQLFHSRVMDQFTHYRKEWRNPSTHDYQLAFSEQEAFLAILSVSAFVSILLDQIIESYARKIEIERLSSQAKKLSDDLGELSGDLIEAITTLAIAFSKEKVPALLNANAILHKKVVVGSLAGFIETVSPSVNIILEPLLTYGNKKFRPDLLLQRNGQSVIMEVKNSLIIPEKQPKLSSSSSVQQLLRTLNAGNIDEGIIYVFPLTYSMGQVERKKIDLPEEKQITIIAPGMYFSNCAIK